MSRLLFHPDAEAEFVAAISYYEECDPGLGLDFAREVQQALRRVGDYPRLWPEIAREVRRCLVRRFPFGVLYSMEPDGIFILAVMHLHREPAYWQRRQRPQ